MTISTTYTFDSAPSFVTDDTVITGGSAELAIEDKTGIVATQTFTADTGFTYNSSLVAFTGGQAQQIDQRPAGALYYNNLSVGANPTWASGVGTGTLTGGATISGGVLNLPASPGGATSMLSIAPAGVFPTGQTGCVRFTFTPNYSGSPGVNNYIFAVSEAENDISNFVRIMHIGTNLRLDIYNAAGTSIITTQTGNTFNPVAGTPYEFEFNWDVTIGTGFGSRFFLNGVLLNGTQAGTGLRNSAIGLIRFGRDYTSGATFGINGTIDNIVFFAAPQHSTNYTPGASIPQTIYSESLVVAPDFTYTGLGEIQSIDSATSSQTGVPKYIVEGQYWNGSAWVASNGTYAQANTIAEVNTNVPTIDTSGQTALSWSVVVPSSNTQAAVSDFALTYTGQRYAATGTVEPAMPIDVRELVGYTHSATETVNTYVRVILKINGVLKYWNGTAWVNSNGAEAQSNTVATLTTGLAALDLGSNSTIYVRWLLISNDNDNTTPYLNDATVVYEYGAIETELSVCEVYGYLKDISDSPVVGATVTFQLSTGLSAYTEADNNVVTESVSIVTDANGYFSQPLIWSSEFTTPAQYKVVIRKGSSRVTKTLAGLDLLITVPDAALMDITDLL